MSLTWSKKSDYHLESACGRYTISKTMRLDKTWRYTAWRVTTSKHESSEALGSYDNPTEAKQRAQIHAVGLPA